MEKDNIIELAKKFEQLHSDVEQQLTQHHDPPLPPATQQHITQQLRRMEEILNQIEIESAISTNTQSQINIQQTCRQSFNSIRKKFTQLTQSQARPRQNREEVAGEEAFYDIEHLHSRYGSRFIGDEFGYPLELKRMQRR